MSNKTNTLLCDIGGTHARFARLVGKGVYDNFKKYRLTDFNSFSDMVKAYLDETELQFDEAWFSTALVPVNGVLAYKRQVSDPDLHVDFESLAQQFKWKKWVQKMDSQAGGTGLKALSPESIQTLIPTTITPLNDEKILIAVGTGVYHALVKGDSVSTQTDGHYLPVTVTDEHRAVESFIRSKKNPDLSLIMEDFVSARGLRSIMEYVSGKATDTSKPEAFLETLGQHPDAIRLFFEFLGLYTHMAVTISGHYGGVYLTGGVIDHLIKAQLTHWTALESYLYPPMLPVVNNRLSSIGVHYVLHDELPLLGLTIL